MGSAQVIPFPRKDETATGGLKAAYCKKGLFYKEAAASANAGNVFMKIHASKKPFCEGIYSVELDVIHEANPLELIPASRDYRPGPYVERFEFVAGGQRTEGTEMKGVNLETVIDVIMSNPATHIMMGVVAQVSRLVKDPVKVV
ncbi:hypothetical protein H0O00_04405 [Candidatus Micrarchaeota archaeon]|nr:hypothetical protein [Candidatus Micrarchaeota archaeon]